MHAPAESIAAPPPRRRKWLTVTPAIEFGVLAVAIVVGVATYILLTSGDTSEQLLTPTLLALMLIANLIPAVAILMLVGRRIAKRRAALTLAGGGGRLHVRLVAIFSSLASIPIVLTVIAASVMFQSGAQFWVSDKARNAFESSINLVRESQNIIIERWLKEGSAMTLDIERESANYRIGSAKFHEYFVQNTFYRNLKQSALFSYTKENGVNVFDVWQSPDIVDSQPKDLLKAVFATRITPKVVDEVHTSGRPYVGFGNNLLWIVYEVKGIKDTYLYIGTDVNAAFLQRQMVEGRGILDEYGGLRRSAHDLQLKFNVALFGVALLIMVMAAWIALEVADRLVRPVNELVGAAREVAQGDLYARVPDPRTDDEIGALGRAFNSMTEQLQTQTNELVTANAQLESRRALIEAVMSGVSAGVISIDSDRTVRLINASATSLLRRGGENLAGRPLRDVAPELDPLLDGGDREAVVQITAGGETRTLAVKVTRDEGGQVLTFDDITQQLIDQRRAAWSDVARRIAHEIKNPLTPIQLAAERLQRRYGKQIDASDGTFARLTETIVRQVGDLRRIVDEFSSFARMPKPLFRQESLIDIARQSMFLHEVAHPAIQFAMDTPEHAPLVCDRRQIGQALTNIVKNAVEAIEARGEGEALPRGEIVLAIRSEEGRTILTVADNGIGLPVERDRIAEPYMTTRERGTGLGLAIVKKIVEEHFGTIGFGDREGGGTVVTICFDTELLAKLASDKSEAEENDSKEPRPAALTRNGNKT